MVENILSLVFGLIIPFGPAVYVLAHWQASPEKVSPDMVKLVLAWTAFMMLIKMGTIAQTHSDLHAVCTRLETELNHRLRDATAAREEAGSECHPEDYDPPERDQ